MIIGGQGKVGHKDLPIAFSYPGYLTQVSDEDHPEYSVFHNNILFSLNEL